MQVEHAHAAIHDMVTFFPIIFYALWAMDTQIALANIKVYPRKEKKHNKQ